MKNLTAFFMFTVISALIAGCGGGGSGGSSERIYGIANINALAERPKVAVLDLVGGNFITKTVATMPRAAYGWQDVSFSVNLPRTNSTHAYSLVIFNDTNNNGKYDDYMELLGFYDYFLYYDSYLERWSVINDYANYVYYDATACRGGDIYIDCPFERSRAVKNTTSPDAQQKTREMIDRYNQAAQKKGL